MSRRGLLGAFEYDVMRALIDNPEANYGKALAEAMARPQGAVATTLMRLEAKGFVTSSWSDPTTEIGGRRRRMFSINLSGQHALTMTAEHFRQRL